MQYERTRNASRIGPNRPYVVCRGRGYRGQACVVPGEVQHGRLAPTLAVPVQYERLLAARLRIVPGEGVAHGPGVIFGGGGNALEDAASYVLGGRGDLYPGLAVPMQN